MLRTTITHSLIISIRFPFRSILYDNSSFQCVKTSSKIRGKWSCYAFGCRLWCLDRISHQLVTPLTHKSQGYAMLRRRVYYVFHLLRLRYFTEFAPENDIVLQNKSITYWYVRKQKLSGCIFISILVDVTYQLSSSFRSASTFLNKTLIYYSLTFAWSYFESAHHLVMCILSDLILRLCLREWAALPLTDAVFISHE